MQTNRPLPCSLFAGRNRPLLLRPRSLATAFLDGRTNAVKVIPRRIEETLPTSAINYHTRPTKPGTGHHPGSHSDSRVILDLHSNGHVASRSYPAGPLLYVRNSRRGIVSGDSGNRPFLGAEHRSSSRTHQQQIFAVRHRLRSSLLARAFAPFMVELFAVGFFGPSPVAVTRPVPPVTRSEAPHASRG